MANNIIILIIILVVIGVVVYLYYNHKKILSTIQADTPENQNDNTAKPKKNRKKVRFDDNVIYHTYDRKGTKQLSGSSKDSIDVDKLFSPSIASDEKSETVYPSNLDRTDPEELWDANFGLPLMTHNEKQKYVAKMQKNYKDYEKSLGKFVKYQTDDSTIIKTDASINPFSADQIDKIFKGKTIKEIYDDQVAGPKAKPKQIKYQTSTSLVYENESELNGGQLQGTNLCAFDSDTTGFKSANLKNEF